MWSNILGADAGHTTSKPGDVDCFDIDLAFLGVPSLSSLFATIARKVCASVRAEDVRLPHTLRVDLGIGYSRGGH